MAALKAVPPAAAEASESARLAVGLKRELIDLVKARDYVAALAVCEKLAPLVPGDAVVEQYRALLGEKIQLDDESSSGEEEESSSGEVEEESSSGEEEESSSGEEEEESSSSSSDASDEEGGGTNR